jgi:hypothetical protein
MNFTLKTLLKDRTFQSLLSALLMIVIIGSLRPDKPKGMSSGEYWARKIQWQHCTDIVLLGDSRTFTGVSPAEMSKYLTNKRIVNYGFAGMGFSKQYLQTTENVLDPKSSGPTIVMGISPHSLTDYAIKQNGFTTLLENSKQDLYVSRYFGAIIDFLEPMSFHEIFYCFFPDSKPYHFDEEYFEDGWVAQAMRPEQPQLSLEGYYIRYAETQVSDVIIDNIMQFVNKWSKANINVYGFRPPSSVAMVELENKLSGFDQDTFVAAFEAAGGRWINIDQTSYQGYDGEHLDYKLVLKLSRTLAKHIQRFEDNQTN